MKSLENTLICAKISPIVGARGKVRGLPNNSASPSGLRGRVNEISSNSRGVTSVDRVAKVALSRAKLPAFVKLPV